MENRLTVVQNLKNKILKPDNTLKTEFLSASAARKVLYFLLAVKLTVTVYNAFSYNCAQYDFGHHAPRARVGGFTTGKMAYNPPLYYMPSFIFPEELRNSPEKLSNHDLLRLLRGINIFYIAIFYICWIFFIFPAVTGNWKSAFLASIILLMLPGYQKLAVMAHPDNLLAMSAGLAFAIWIWIEKRNGNAKIGDGKLSKSWPFIFLILSIILISMTRPFAVVPVFVMGMGLAYLLKKGKKFWSTAFMARVLGAGIFLMVTCSSWYVYRWATSGHVLNAYRTNYINAFKPYRKDFDFVHYFTSFYFEELLTTPNRKIFFLEGDPTGEKISQTRKEWGKKSKREQNKLKAQNPLANSFFTTLYSEFWGDHWLYFSSSRRYQDRKVWPKRILLACALPFTLMILFSFFKNTFINIRNRIRLKSWLNTSWILAITLFSLGIAVYLYWQTGDALLPGKNSTIKFIYISYLVPFFIAIAMSRVPSKRSFYIWAGYTLLLFMIAWPVATFFPNVPDLFMK